MNVYSLLTRYIVMALVIVHASYGFSQEMSNEDYNRIIIMEGEFGGSLEVFVDPLHFDCTCDDVISHLLFLSEEKTVNEQLVYISEDGYIQLDIQDNYYIITANMELGCCAIRPGTFTANPSRWDLETEEEE